MTASDVPVADRLRRIASIRLGRPLPDVSDPADAAGVAGSLAAVADPPLTGVFVAALADALSGAADTVPRTVADRVTACLGLPDGALDPDADFAGVEDDLLSAFLGERGVLEVWSCRGRRGAVALLGLLGSLDRRAAGPAGT